MNGGDKDHAEEDPLALTLCPPTCQPPPPPPPPHRAPRRNHTKATQKSELIDPPFPWATDRRATIHTLNTLLARGITTVHGEAQCRRCEWRETTAYDLRAKFLEVAGFVEARKHEMHDRAPAEWLSPELPACPSCGQANSMRPVLAGKKRAINWLFLLLGQTIGCCTLEQLKYFCKHTKNHRTGAKDRVLYLTYLDLCKQLDPTGPFRRN